MTFASEKMKKMRRAPFLATICISLLGGVLVAGLWPLHAPRNEVNWLSDGNGLFFGSHGSIVSVGPFAGGLLGDQKSCSLEISLEPRRIDSGGMILAFYWPTTRVVPFALRQWRRGLVVEYLSDDPAAKKTEIYIGDVFSNLKPVFLTISSGENGTAIYADGTLLKRVSNPTFSNRHLTAQLVVGNAATTSFTWSGEISGLAIYNRELTGSQVSQHFADWEQSKQLYVAKSDRVIASYLFDERDGVIVHNKVGLAGDLLIPDRFFVLHQQFLERPWNEYHPGWGYWRNIGINVVGFIPLGFFFCAYFREIRKIDRAPWLTVVLGFAVSLTIEVLQSFLPTRDSGVTDLLTNTLGTALGTIACVWSIKRECFARGKFRASPREREDVLMARS
jgi:hypothetical protein